MGAVLRGKKKTLQRKRGRPRADAANTVGRPGQPASSAGSVGPEALIQLTCEMLTRIPPGDVTRAAVARHAGVDPALIRYYFKNRDALMRTATEALTKTLQKRGAAASERTDLAPAERICARLLALLEFKIENPFYHRLMMEEMARSEDAKSRELFQGIATTAVERYRGYIKAGVEDGSLREVDPAFLYMAIIGMCDFFALAAPLLTGVLKEDDPYVLRENYGKFLCDLILNGLSTR
jgi:AcrR family transcriptional regulator